MPLTKKFINLGLLAFYISLYLLMLWLIGITDSSAVLVDYIAGGALLLFAVYVIKEITARPKSRPPIKYLFKEGFINVNQKTGKVDVSNCPYYVEVYYSPIVVLVYYPDDPANAYAFRLVKTD